MTAGGSTFIAGVLQKTGLFQKEQIDALLDATRDSGSPLAEMVVKQGLAREDDFLEALGRVLRIPFIRLGDSAIESSVLEKLPTKTVFQSNVVPVKFENGTLTVATNNPLDSGLIDSLRLASGGRVKLVLSTSEEISKTAKKFYGVGAETVDRMIQDNRLEVEPVASGKLDLNELDQEASVVKFVNQIVWEAFQQSATDIHFEPMESRLRIRYRVDGVLHETPVPSQLARFQAAILSRLKVMANMDIAEKRLPMDGRIGMRIQGQDLDIRVSTMPTVYGESVSLRLLRGSGSLIGIRELGMSARDTKVMQRLINKPNGIILVTGPTGSGKSTSLYAYLHEINTIDQRILTAEEPIEYQMQGVNQVLIRPEIGLTFARVLRHFLRQDPDIIMVGEVRDLETAEIAIQAALTGHLVFSTLHTNDAAGAFTRLMDMGVEPYLLASAVEAIVAQRLVRKLCPVCRVPAETDAASLKLIGFPEERPADAMICQAGRCEKCRMTGYRGRGGIFEVLDVSEPIESLVIQRASSSAIKQKAMSEGMRTLRDDGWDKVMQGFTTIDEVLRVSEEND